MGGPGGGGRKGQALLSQDQWNLTCMNTEYLRQQALQMNKERIEGKEIKRNMTYHRAREEEQARIEYHQRKIEEDEEKARFMEVPSTPPSLSPPRPTTVSPLGIITQLAH